MDFERNVTCSFVQGILSTVMNVMMKVLIRPRGKLFIIRRYVTSCISSLLYCFGVRGVTIINLGVRATLIYRVFLSVNRKKYELKTMILSFNLYAEFY